MKLQVTQENLAKALSSVARVATTRNTLPVLANVLITTIDNRVSIAATNLDIGITHFIGSKVKQEGKITVPARLMQDFVNNLPSGVIELEADEHRLHITTKDYESTINGISAEEFPVMPALTNGTDWTVNAKLLKKALQQVVFAASSDETRPVLTAVYLHTYKGDLYAVATDSYRLAEKKIQKLAQETALLVPATALQDVLRIVADYEGDVIVSHDEQQVLFRIGDVELVTRQIDGTYPDYRKLIPAKFVTTAQLKKDEFTTITKVSGLFARESAGSITIRLDEDKKQISIRSVASQLGENVSTAEAEVVGDGDVTLNSRYLLDGLHVFEGSTINLGFNGKLEPCVLRDTAHEDYLHLIMPLKS